MQKTKKSVVKRFKITATGKVFSQRAGRRHLLQTKSSRRRRSLRRPLAVSPADTARVKESLPFGGR